MTVLFTDIVESTRMVFSLGDLRWLELQTQHEAVVRVQLKRFGGRYFRSTGDGFVVIFGSAVSAVHAAAAIIENSRPLGLEVRAALHAGECETRGGRPTGLIFHVCARIVALASGSEILVSHTVRDVTAGANLGFAERGNHELRGLPGRWALYRVTPARLARVTLPGSSRRPIAPDLRGGRPAASAAGEPPSAVAAVPGDGALSPGPDPTRSGSNRFFGLRNSASRE